MKKIFIAIIIFSCSVISQTRVMGIDDLFKSKRISDPQISPDGKWISFVVGVVNKDENKTNNDIWIMNSNGEDLKQLTSDPKSDNHPRWSADSKTISFTSTRKGTPQIFTMDTKGENVKQITNISTGASQQMFSPDGKMISFISSVYPEFSSKTFSEMDKLNKEKDEQIEKSKVKAKVFTQLLYRHWDSWTDFKRMHIFIQNIEIGEPINLTPGERDAVPNSSTFSAGDDYGWSMDSKEIAYTVTPTPTREEAWSTNHDIFTVNIQSLEKKQITKNLAADTYPRYSPDGKYIAYRSQNVAGFEADKWDIVIYNRATSEVKNITKNWDYVVTGFEWSSDSKYIFTPSEEEAEELLWRISADGKEIKKITLNGVTSSFSVSNSGEIVFTKATLNRPVEIYKIVNGGEEVKLTGFNNQLFSEINFSAPEKIWYNGARVKNQLWLIRPPNFDPTKKYPLVYLVHGGPQGAWMNGWSNRWNPQLWAAQGYVVVAPNPTGSTGFGQKFTNDISGDWGGAVYVDLMKGLDFVTKKYSFIDTTKMAAAGASYGGYMMNWFQGHTKRFKTLITHCGVYNFVSMYGTTEEVWFDDWEHGGAPWEKKDEYNKFSPHNYAENFSTPNLIIHNELDFRVPFSEGMQLFTTLQKKGVESKLVYFPDEGHWVLKPQNSEFWHKQVFTWLEEYLKK
ncbi:MAG: S9 family peptidase [Bacteroidetes bacterium]|nr:S9 family peptidase [Bacteroidota bacterium]